MAASAGKTIGLILLILFIVFLSLRLTPLILAPLGIFSGAAQVLHRPDLRMGGWLYPWNSMNIFSLALLFIWIAVIIWVYRDAERRGMNGVLWALLVLIGNLIALIIYLIVRTDNIPAPRKIPPPSKPPSSPSPSAASPKPIAPSKPVVPPAPTGKNEDCPKCGKTVATEFAFCPHCGSSMQRTCPKCGKDVETGWKACPHCGENLAIKPSSKS
jgi:RNA polymerase subunit RPABC4/transcription elongation factor Spt4